MKGFMFEIYIGSLFGYRPNFDHLFADVEELATELMPADSAAADL
jgi:hypothetical protein